MIERHFMQSKAVPIDIIERILFVLFQFRQPRKAAMKGTATATQQHIILQNYKKG